MKVEKRKFYSEEEMPQGSKDWLELRAYPETFTASEAPAMMGRSKYQSRNQLLNLKNGGPQKEVSEFQQTLFNKGHESEAKAREIYEIEQMEDFAPCVITCEVEGLKLLASLDGLSEDRKTVFEHKLWNDTLAENVKNGVLDDMYTVQLEQQILVSGADKAVFIVSDGTAENREIMEYTSKQNRISNILAGWRQFEKDLKDYTPEAKPEIIVGEDAESFPIIEYSVTGTDIVSNIGSLLPLIQERAKNEMSRKLETDQDFADKEKLNKATKEARSNLKDVVLRVKNEFDSFAKFSDTAGKLDGILQKMQSHGEKQVKEAKEAKKQMIISKAAGNISEAIVKANGKLSPVTINDEIGDYTAELKASIKGKRTIESIQNAVDSVTADTNIKITNAVSRIALNLGYLVKHKKYQFLFNDIQELSNESEEAFKAIIDGRIAAHKKQEEKNLESERERIKKEEEAKAQKKLADERELIRQDEEKKANAKLEREREKIRIEEAEKLAKQEEIKKETAPPPVAEKQEPAAPKTESAKKDSLVSIEYSSGPSVKTLSLGFSGGNPVFIKLKIGATRKEMSRAFYELGAQIETPAK